MIGEHPAAAEDLHRVVHDPLCGLGGEDFGHRRLERDARGAAVLLPRRAIDEQPGRGQIGRHASQLFLNQLKIGNWLPELPARARVRDGFSQGARRHPAGRGTYRCSDAVERREAQLVAFAFGIETAGAGNAGVYECDFTERMRRGQHQRTHEPQARYIGSDDEAADPFVRLSVVGGGEHRVEIGDPGVRDERLCPGQDVAVAVALCARAERCNVGAGLRLGHRERGHRLAADRWCEPALLHGVVFGEQNRHGAERLQREDSIGERRACP